jgi:hypothetical protein
MSKVKRFVLALVAAALFAGASFGQDPSKLYSVSTYHGPFSPSYGYTALQYLGPFFEMPFVLQPTDANAPTAGGTAALSVSYTSGKIFVGGTAVYVTAGTLGSLTASATSCSAPTFSSCDIVYANSSGTVAFTQTFATALGSANSILAFVTTSGTTVTGVTYPYEDTTRYSQTAGPTAITGSLTVSTTLGVTGASTLTGNTSVGGTLGVTGAATLNSTLDQKGAATFESTVVGELQPAVAVGATLSPTCAQSGSLILVGAASGEVVTLPAAGAGTVGCWFDFVITVSNTSAANEIATTGSNYLLGSVAHSATGIAALTFWADGSSIKALKMDGAHLGGLIGSTLRVVGISATQWAISGTNLCTSPCTTGFTATP